MAIPGIRRPDPHLWIAAEAADIIDAVSEVVVDEGPVHCTRCGTPARQKTVEVDGERIDVIITCPRCGRFRNENVAGD